MSTDQSSVKPASGRCLVLGANGFIGSHLVDELVQAKFKVRAFDRFTQAPQFQQNEKIEIIKGDIMNMTHVQNAMKDVDYLFHCFSATTPFLAEDDPFTDITHNLLHSVRLFEQSVSAGVKKILYISSGGAIYGKTGEGTLLTEESTPQPVSPYGICKLATEHYLEYFKRKFGIDYVAYRLTNPYGPRQVLKNNQGVIPAFMGNISNGEEITVYGDGMSSRDYIYITDAASMIVSTFGNDNKHPVYNIGSGQQTSINTLISVIQEQLKRTAKVTYVGAPKTFVTKVPVSIERYVEDFGLPNLTSLEEGIKITTKQFKPTA